MPIQNINTVAQAGDVAGSSVLNIASVSKTGEVGSAPVGYASAGLSQAASKQAPSIAQLQRLIISMNKAIQQSNSNLEFTIDKDSERILVKLIDISTGDVIRQIPSEEALAIAQSIEQMQQGLLLNKNA